MRIRAGGRDSLTCNSSSLGQALQLNVRNEHVAHSWSSRSYETSSRNISFTRFALVTHSMSERVVLNTRRNSMAAEKNPMPRLRDDHARVILTWRSNEIVILSTCSFLSVDIRCRWTKKSNGEIEKDKWKGMCNNLNFTVKSIGEYSEEILFQ